MGKVALVCKHMLEQENFTRRRAKPCQLQHVHFSPDEAPTMEDSQVPALGSDSRFAGIAAICAFAHKARPDKVIQECKI